MKRDPSAQGDAELFEYHRGLHLKETLLWFDAAQPRELCFVSHARVPSAQLHQKILCTESTASLLGAAAAAHGRGRRAHEPRALITPYRRPFALGQLTLELFPAGYVLGSASLLVEHQGRAVVYAGQINPRAGEGQLVERLEARRCDVLVLPCSLAAHRRFALPPQADVREQLLRFVKRCLSEGATPVLFCTPIGEAQEVLALLQAAEIPARLHRQIYAASAVYQADGPSDLLALGRGARRYERPIKPGAGEALIWPSRLSRSPVIDKQPSPRRALVSAAALDADVVAEVGCEAAFALSSETDYRGLIDYVRACQPRTVLLTGSPSAELADDLTALGIRVNQLGPREQLDLF